MKNKNIEIVIFNDKSWVRFTEYQESQEENERLAKRICELQSDLSRAKSQIEKMKCCFNCDKPIKHLDCGDCHNGSNWELSQSERLIRS